MIKRTGKLLILLVFLMGVGTATASAQLIGALDVNVPHSFFVNKTELPAGQYTVRVLDDTSPNMMELRSVDGRNSVMFDTENAQPNGEPRESELVFDKLGDDYFLSRIWLEGDSYVGYELEKPAMEKQLEGRGIKAEKHQVAMNRR